jgi:acyl-coenzyme A synthetase/AMP-(fatty) acid ligase
MDRHMTGEMPFSSFEWDIPERFNFAVDVVDHWAENGNPPALIWENEKGDTRRFTYSEISTLSKRLAHALVQQGVGKGDFVLVVMPRIPEWQIAVTAAMRIGAVPVPCIEMLTAKDIAYRATHCRAKAVICRAAQVSRIEAGLETVPVRFSIGAHPGWQDVNAALEQPHEAEAAEVLADDPAILYYTSGSSGNPKGVVHAARAIHAWRYSARFWLDVKPGDRIWCTADTGWSKAGTSILFGPWSEGGTAFFYDGPFDACTRLRLLADNRITIYCAPGTELSRLVQEDVSTFDLSALRRTVTAGEAMNVAVADAWKSATGLTMAEAYGQTETLMSLLTLVGMTPRIGSMGVAAPGLDMAIIDEGGNPLPDGETGHIALRLPNPQMMQGYLNAPEKMAENTVEGPGGKYWLTGDLGWRDGDGFFWYEGRADDIINSAGYRIGPTEVENALAEHPAVLECAAVAAPDKERGSVVKAVIVLKAGHSPSDALTQEIQGHVKKATAPYKYPRIIEYCDELPKGATGKILRRALRK